MELNEYKFFQKYIARISNEFDSSKDLESAKKELRPRILAKISSRELRDSKWFGLRALDVKDILMVKKYKIRKVGCESIRHLSLRYFLMPSPKTHLSGQITPTDTR